MATSPSAALAQGTPSITVVANPAFRPTGVLLPHFQFTVAVDSAAGGLVMRDLTINPVTFTGALRVEGIQPGARAPEAPAYADSVRFGGDGQVTLLVAGGAGRSPITVEPRGARGAAGGRLAINAPGWPPGRAILVTIDPADLFEHRWRSVGYGVRDRIRVDDRRVMAFLTDTTVPGTTVAVGVGGGARATVGTEAAELVLEHRFGAEVGRERRTVGRLLIAIDPARDDAGNAHAEVLFGLGGSEDGAARAAQAAAAEGEAPRATTSPRVSTPARELDLALAHVLAAARPMLDWDRIGGSRSIPAGSSDRLSALLADGWRGAAVATQLGDADAVCAHYRLFERWPAQAGRLPREVAIRLGARGRYDWADTAGSSIGERASALILAGYACYRTRRDSAWLAAELPRLRTGADLGVAGDSAAAARDPASGAQLAEALERLGEMEGEATARWRMRAVPEIVARWRSTAERIRAALPAQPSQPPWATLPDAARRMLNQQYGRPSERADTNGVSMAVAGALLEQIAGELFGVDEHLDLLEIAPRLERIADEHLWRLEGWRLSGDSLGIAYRPQDRAATLRLGAPHGWRIVLRLPWLTGASCVSVRRGGAVENLALVVMTERSFYVDLRAGFDPAELTISERACD